MEQWTEKIKQLGKDRFLFLLVAGLCLVFLTEYWERRNSAMEPQKQAQIEKDETDEKEMDGNQREQNEMLAIANKEMSLQQYEQYYGKRLEDFLSQMYGAGSAKVLVTMECSPELILAKDCPYVRKNEEETSQAGTRSYTEIQNEAAMVFYEDEDGKKTPVILKELAPDVAGIVVLVSGGEKKGVRDEITLLLEALFGLDSHKIRVAKLK